MKHKKLQRKSTEGEGDDKGSEHAQDAGSGGEDADQSLERAHSEDGSDSSSLGHRDDAIDDGEEIDVVSDSHDVMETASQNHVVTSQMTSTIIRHPFPIKPTTALHPGVHASLLPPGAFLSAPHLTGLPLKAKSQ